MSESTLTVTPSQLTVLLSKTIPAGYPVLITGAPGIGKSDIVSQAAQAANAELILSHPAVADPTDVKGFPWVADGHATFLPFGELRRAMQATTSTVWFLDDLGQASPAVQASYMQLLLARRVNGHVLPDCVTFIAATNRRKDRAGVSGILEPVKSRFTTIVELTPDLAAWCTWALSHDVPAEVIAFLRFKPDMLSAFTPTADLVNCPSPRTWAHVARMLSLGLPSDVQHAALAGAIGAEVATEFVSFLRMYATLPSVDAILLNPTSEPVPDSPSTLYALSGALAYRANTNNFARITMYAERMLTARHGEFATLLVRDAITRHPELKQTAAYVRVNCSELGQLMSGAS